MKKLFVLLLALSLLTFAGCSTTPTASDANVEGALADLLPKVTQGAYDEEMMTMDNEITSELFNYYFSIDYIEGCEALSRDAAINTIPYSMSLLRLPEGADFAQIEQDLKDNLNPRKWVCVEAEASQVARRGNLILVAMGAQDQVDKAVSNFNGLS